jgi:hypothetical protein
VEWERRLETSETAFGLEQVVANVTYVACSFPKSAPGLYSSEILDHPLCPWQGYICVLLRSTASTVAPHTYM